MLGAVAIAASLRSWSVLIAAFHDGTRYNAVGADFMVFHGAARLALEGRLATVFDGERLTAFLNQAYQAWLPMNLTYRPWVYPPSFLLLASPIGLLDFPQAYLTFQILTAAALVAALVVGAGEESRSAQAIAAAALLSPAAADNIGSGQNAFLITAVLVAGFRLLNPRPILAGAILGFLTIKPQFALMAPIALIAARQWRAMAGAAATALLLVAASALVFGIDSWMLWLRQATSNLAASDLQWTRFGRLWGDSIWTCAMLLGAAPGLASLLQWTSAAWAGGAVAVAYRSAFGERTKLAILLAATALAAPYWSFYDAVLLVVAGLLGLSARRPGEALLWPAIGGLALWLVPTVSPPVLVPAGRLAPLVIAGFVAAALWAQPRRSSSALPAAQFAEARQAGGV